MAGNDPDGPALGTGTTRGSADYSVDGLLNAFGLIGERLLEERAARRVRVFGHVAKVRPWKRRFAYLTLSGAGHTVEARCPFEMAPREGEAIVFEGEVRLTPSRLQPGLDVQIIGMPAGTWTPGVETAETLALPVRERRPLRWVLDRAGPEGLLILGTETAVRDTLSALAAGGSSSVPASEIIGMSDAETIGRQVARHVGSRAPAGIALVRGGDDAGLSAFDSPDLVRALLSLETPFYTGLGHAHRVTLADKAADAAFMTPSQLGAAVADLCAAMEERNSLRERVAQLETRLGGVPRKPALRTLIGLGLLILLAALALLTR